MGQCPRARVVDQLSWATRSLDQGPHFEQLSRATRARARGPVGSTSCPGRLGPVSEGHQDLPDVPSDLRSGPFTRCRGVDQLSRVTWAWVLGPVLSTSCPERLGRVNEGPRGEAAVPATCALVRGPTESKSPPGRLGPMTEIPRGRPAVLGVSVPCLMAYGVDQLSRANVAMA